MLRKDPSKALPFAPLLRRLDGMAAKPAVATGLAAGVLGGVALTNFAPLPVALAGFLLLLGLAAALAWSGEPVELVDFPSPVASLTDLVEIPGGTFRMGSPAGEIERQKREGPAHSVTLSAFLLMRYPVTRRQYAELMGADPGWPKRRVDDCPANSISWVQAIEFCNRLSERERLSPAYRFVEQSVTWERSADGYRLPTEAEWEYACRAGTQTPWSFGSYEKQLSDHAWFDGNSSGAACPVGQKQPNAWGIHDMHGNVFEWCWDWYDSYPEESQADPSGPPSGAKRVLRGGSFNSPPWVLRSAFRFRHRQGVRDWDIGFRCARSPRGQP